MHNSDSKFTPSIPVKNTGLIKVGNSIQITNKLLEEHSRRELAPKFKSVIIGSQEWMTENLSVECFQNGDIISEIKTNEEWLQAGLMRRPAWCYYENDQINGDRFGKLYNWYAVNDRRGLAPKEWHIPKIEEWKILIKHIEDWTYLKDDKGNFLDNNPARALKSISGWGRYNWEDNCPELNPNAYDGNGTNKSGFNAIPSGKRGINGNFNSIGEKAHFWSMTEYSMLEAISFTLHTNNIFHSLYPYPFYENYNLRFGLSIRCLKD